MTKDGHYKAYILWRKSQGYKLWLKKQWKLQNGCCYYCHNSLIGMRHNVEHVIPQSRWGLTNNKNMVLSCPQCNKNKGSSMPSKKTIKIAKVFNGYKQKLSLTQLYGKKS